MFASDRVVLLVLKLPLHGLLVLGRILSVALAATCLVSYGDELDEMDL